MSSIVVLTPAIREIPYFSSFSENETSITIPRSFINETIKYDNEYKSITSPSAKLEYLENIKFDDLVSIIENLVYLGFDNNEDYVKELLWRLGETEEKMNMIDTLNSVVQYECTIRLKKENYKNTYGIRCRFPFVQIKICIIAGYGNLQLLKWSTASRFYWKENHYMYIEAVRNNQLEVLKWIRENGGTRDHTCETCNIAAENGNLELLKWVREDGCGWNGYTCSKAAMNGHLEVLKLLHENHCPWNTTTCIEAAMNGHLEVLKYALKNDCPWSETMCSFAAENGHLEVLKWLSENGYLLNKRYICIFAAQQGRLEVLKYLKEIGGELSSKVCSGAANYGHLEVLKWLRENGGDPCPWDEETCTEAARYDHLDVLKYAHENGCPWNADTYATAFWNGCTRVLKYLVENNCPKNMG